jgi:hypothetical protein
VGCGDKDKDTPNDSNGTETSKSGSNISITGSLSLDYYLKTFVIAKEYTAFTISGLSTHTKKIGEVFCSPSAWGRIIKKYKWGRSRQRIYPAKPKIGLYYLFTNSSEEQ